MTDVAISQFVHNRGENPKEIASRGKRPDYSVIPETSLAQMAGVLGIGDVKYERFNWRERPIKLSAYKRAAMGHLLWAFAGE